MEVLAGVVVYLSYVLIAASMITIAIAVVKLIRARVLNEKKKPQRNKNDKWMPVEQGKFKATEDMTRSHSVKPYEQT